MANRDCPRGLEPSGELLRATSYIGVSTIYPGELVLREAGGRVAIATVCLALAGVALSYCSATGQPLLVADHPQQRFVCQADGTDVDALTAIGLNYQILATGENSTYKISRMEIDASLGMVTATLALRVIAIEPRGNNALGDNVDVIVQINNHCFGGGTGAVGV